ncbi:cold-shock protein [Bacillus cereus group sp. N28]|uniref:cold-shock protein n=1 Tax=Bacillus cereus group sp. N28 TaxID=2794593 RepID=UPI0034D41B77
MRTGTVNRFLEEKGFGFITPDDGGEEVFFSSDALPTFAHKTIKEGQRVEFDIAFGTSGRIFAPNVLPR